MDSKQVFEYIKDCVNEPIDRIRLGYGDEDGLNEAVVNRLLSLDNEEIKDWLWNALDVDEADYDVDRSSLSEEGKAFVSEALEALRAWLKRVAICHPVEIHRSILFNINEDIDGERLVLRPCAAKDNHELYLHHVAVDGDFLLYVTPDSKDDSPSGVWPNTLLPFAFYIYAKDTGEEIGVISLYDHENKHHERPLSVAYFHYYIYKPFRHKGYAYEAGSMLIDAFFNKKLKNEVVTCRHFMTEERFCEPQCIKIDTNGKNLASIALAEKLGFVYEGTDYGYKTTDGVPQDENHYSLSLERYLETRRK